MSNIVWKIKYLSGKVGEFNLGKSVKPVLIPCFEYSYCFATAENKFWFSLVIVPLQQMSFTHSFSHGINKNFGIGGVKQLNERRYLISISCHR